MKKIRNAINIITTFFKALNLGTRFALAMVEAESKIFEHGKLQGISYSEIQDQWVYCLFRDQHVIVLSEIIASAKSLEFWAKIPDHQKVKFVDDVVVLRCNSSQEMKRLVRNIEENFAEATGYSNGLKVITNMDWKKVE